VILFPTTDQTVQVRDGRVRCRARLGGMLKHYHRAAALNILTNGLDQLILIGESSLRRALCQFTEHYHRERNHQGKGKVLLFRRVPDMWSIDSMLRTPRWPSQVLLLKGRTNFL
jgi:hypothetical protein